MKWLLRDGDLWLLLLLIGAGAIPVLLDAFSGRDFGAQATVGGLVATASLVGLAGRVKTHVQASLLRRRLTRPS